MPEMVEVGESVKAVHQRADSSRSRACSTLIAPSGLHKPESLSANAASDWLEQGRVMEVVVVRASLIQPPGSDRIKSYEAADLFRESLSF